MVPPLAPNRLRRWVTYASLAVFVGALALPGLAQLARFDRRATIAENRTLAPPPVWPDGWTGLLAWPAQADAWLRDHFGFRARLLRANTRLRYALFHETPNRQVLFGRHDRLFLSSRDGGRPGVLIADICGVRKSPADIDAAAEGIRTLLHAAAADAPEALFVSVPSAPAVYPEDLPDWLVRQCVGPNSVQRVMQRLEADPALASRVVYPLATLLAAKASGRVVPRYNFHWSGRGAEPTAAMIAEAKLGLHRAVEIPVREQTADSDLSGMVPGLTLRDRIVVPDFAAAGVQYCYARPECLPGLEDMAGVIGDYGRTVSPRAGTRRLLVLGDSFASFIAPWFGAYFGEVRQISTNYLDRLSVADRGRLRAVLFGSYRPDAVIFLYLDGGIFYAPDQLTRMLWPSPALASVR